MESRKYPPYQNNYNFINSFDEDENDLPTKEEIDRVRALKNRQLNNNNIKDSNFFDDIGDDTDENIQINLPSQYKSLNKSNQLYINNPNNINSINFDNYDNNNIISNNNNFINNNNIYNNNIYSNNIYNNNINDNNINNEMDSYLDSNGNIIYRNNNNINNNSNGNNDVEIQKLDSHRIKVGNNEFEDLTNEAREIQNKEAFEKKILGIYKEERQEIVPEKKPFLERVGDFIENHEDGILAVIDGIGCILLHGPSIVRTINRVDRWIDNIGSNNEPNQENNILNEVGLRDKEKDLNTILKFLPVWEVRENKKHDNNNSCVVCLCEFQIGDIISALPCCHVFHTECIKNWFKNELTCPVCKFEVTLSSIIGSHNP